MEPTPQTSRPTLDELRFRRFATDLLRAVRDWKRDGEPVKR